MKYYVIELSTEDSGKTVPGTYPYDTLDDALASYHNKMGGVMKNKTYAAELIMVINSDGGVHVTDKWIRPVEPKEPVTAE